jgi:signal transduction histidine kinase
MSDAPLARILIVDDETTIMLALCRTLGEQGYEVEGAASGEEALSIVRQRQFDLILADLMMPGMDGISVVRAVLQIDPGLVAVVMTGAGTIASAVDAMKAGALDYIQKPFKVSVILPVLSRALAIRQLRIENAQLDSSLRKRTAELEAANKELEAFSSSVSHDLRGPLRAINGFSAILVEDHCSQLSEDAQSLLNMIVSSARQMNRLIDDLLRLSRLGRHELVWENVNTRTLVESVLAEFRLETTNRKMEIKVEDLPDCYGDPALLKQVYVNLLSNALKFTSKCEIAVIQIGCASQNREKIYSVRDNGAGFDLLAAKRLFADFQRFHSEEEFEGTGVGLSIVRRIIERHGGRVWAEAEVNKGATFYFALPE